MSNFTCPHCGTDIIDTPRGYITGCEHYPIEQPSQTRDLWPLVEQIIASGRIDPPTNPNPKRNAK